MFPWFWGFWATCTSGDQSCVLMEGHRLPRKWPCQQTKQQPQHPAMNRVEHLSLTTIYSKYWRQRNKFKVTAESQSAKSRLQKINNPVFSTNKLWDREREVTFRLKATSKAWFYPQPVDFNWLLIQTSKQKSLTLTRLNTTGQMMVMRNHRSSFVFKGAKRYCASVKSLSLWRYVLHTISMKGYDVWGLF